MRGGVETAHRSCGSNISQSVKGGLIRFCWSEVKGSSSLKDPDLPSVPCDPLNKYLLIMTRFSVDLNDFFRGSICRCSQPKRSEASWILNL